MAISIRENISLSNHTIFKIGGRARFFVEVKNSDELIEALNFARAKNTPIFILGAGSNVLVSDSGFEGLIIKITGGKSFVEEGKLKVDAGVMMASAVVTSAKAGLKGFEWGIGVPGTIGGSIRGNAGCFGGEISQVLESVRVLEVKNQNAKFKTTTQNSKLFELSNVECKFGYRDSIFKKHTELIILSATFNLTKGNHAEIQKKIIEYTKHRAKTQDIGAKCAGCIFKNVSLAPLEVSRHSVAAAMSAGRGGPLTGWKQKGIGRERLFAKFPELKQFEAKESIPAGFLIDRSGLKGKRVGGAFISPKHANYFVNDGTAKAKDIITLISVAKDAVKFNYGIALEEEIQYVGF